MVTQLKVKDIIDHLSMSWNLLALNEIISEEESWAILSVPLSPFLQTDQVIWKHSRDDEFTIKSAYGLLANSHAIPSSHTPLPWKRIWSLPIPNKIKVFIWRAAHEALAVNKAIHYRIPAKDPTCPMCSSHDESVIHCLVQCQRVQTIWAKLMGNFSVIGA